MVFASVISLIFTFYAFYFTDIMVYIFMYISMCLYTKYYHPLGTLYIILLIITPYHSMLIIQFSHIHMHYRSLIEKDRSYLAYCHCGMLQLGQKNIPSEHRICKLCDSLVIEDEFHFIFHCSLYKNINPILTSCW